MELFTDIEQARKFQQDIEGGLSPEPENWATDIAYIFDIQFPQLANLPKKVSFVKTLPEYKSAVGKIELIAGDNIIIFPVLIRKGKVAPFDVFIFKETYYPATDARLNAVLYRGASFSRIKPAKATDISSDVVRSTFAPVSMITPTKTAERLLDKVLLKISREDQEKLAQLSKAVLGVVVPSIDKVLTQSEVTRVVSKMEPDVIMVRRNGNDYFLYIGSTKGTFAPLKMRITPQVLKKLLSPSNYDKLFMNPAFYSFVKYPYLRGNVKIVPATRSADFINIDFPCKAQIYSNGKTINGYVFKRCITPGEIAGVIFLDNFGNYYVGSSVLGVPVGRNDFKRKKYTLDELDLPGKRFVLVDTHSQTVYGPFHAGSVIEEERIPQSGIARNDVTVRRTIKVTALDDTGIKTSICITVEPIGSRSSINYAKDISDCCGEQELHAVNIPVVVLKEELNPAPYELNSVISKIAIFPYEKNKYRIELIDSRNPFSGEKESGLKTAEKLTIVPKGVSSAVLEEPELAFALSLLQAPRNSAQMIKQANSAVYINYSAPKLRKTAEVITLDHNSLYELSIIRNRAKEFLKIAQEISDETHDEEYLDKMLALNVVDKETLDEFIKEIPQFENMLTKISKLLIVSRLRGIFDEEELEKLVKFLDNVIQILNKLKLEDPRAHPIAANVS